VELEQQLKQLRTEAKTLREQLQHHKSHHPESLEVLQQQLQQSQEQLAVLRAENITLMQQLVHKQGGRWGAAVGTTAVVQQQQGAGRTGELGQLALMEQNTCLHSMYIYDKTDLESDHGSNCEQSSAQEPSKAAGGVEIGPLDNASENGEDVAHAVAAGVPFTTVPLVNGWSLQ
jgi:hypothetical protein